MCNKQYERSERRTAVSRAVNKQLKMVDESDEDVFRLCAGFLFVISSNPLDETAVHPDDYAAAEKLLEKLQRLPKKTRTAMSTRRI
ncbi:unnamed protein product [Caenorhabditis sp. 36 PRJEB53466]|nr:unnamed protein product [Caenorhabditis sp. 36 PRJEB53466]